MILDYFLSCVFWPPTAFCLLRIQSVQKQDDGIPSFLFKTTSLHLVATSRLLIFYNILNYNKYPLSLVRILFSTNQNPGISVLGILWNIDFDILLALVLTLLTLVARLYAEQAPLRILNEAFHFMEL